MRGWIGVLMQAAIGQAPAGRRARPRPGSGRRSWPVDPRNAVLLSMGAVLLIGGGRRWLQSRRALRAVGRLAGPGLTPGVVLDAADHGRAALMDLFRLLGTAPDAAVREAAGAALATLWARDELIAEEEKAIVSRGFAATWRARRRYPRRMAAPFPVSASYGVPFLRDGGPGVAPGNLEWSHRIGGAERASLEQFSPWRPGPGRVEFTIDPGDFPANGPHRLVLEPRVRTAGLTSSWELGLPHIPFNFEFDPHLAVDALLTLPDDARGAAVAGAIRLAHPEPAGGATTYLSLDDEFALRDPPVLAVATPLPCDLAHAVAVEFEGVPGRFPAGSVVLSGQGTNRDEPAGVRRFPLGPIATIPAAAIDRPGDRRLRVVLTADPDLGWADPDVRSIWPGSIETAWFDARVIRR